MNKQKGFISIAIIIFGVILVIIAIAGTPSILKMARLNSAADKRADTLSEIKIVEGKSTDAVGIVNGDFLTAKDDADQSSFANAKIETDSSFGNLFDYADENLNKAGYKLDTASTGSPYFKLSSLSSGLGTSKSVTSSITLRYLNTDTSSGVLIRYIYSNEIKCPEVKSCTLSDGDSEPDNLFDIKSLYDQTVTSLDITNAHISNDYMLRRGF